MTALEVTDVTVDFGGLRALSDVSLTVGDGDIVSIIGPNGAGKTTLLNAICQVVPTSAGSVVHRGRSVTGLHPTNVTKGGIGRSFQDPRLLEDASIIENVLCGAHCAIGYSTLDQVFRRRKVRRCEAAMAAKAVALLELVGLADAATVQASELPYGARKIVDIVRATIAEPTVLLLDEPSSGLDQGERELVERLILEIHERFDLPMLIVEHHMDLVRRVSDRVVGLVSGSVAASGLPAEVLDSTAFLDLITGNVGGGAVDHPATEEEGATV